MAKKKFRVAVDEEIAQEVDELAAKCDDLSASRFEIAETILTAVVQSGSNRVERVRDFTIPKQKGNSLASSKTRALGARNS